MVGIRAATDGGAGTGDPNVLERAVGVEDLHARVLAVGHVDKATPVDDDRVRHAELALMRARLPKFAKLARKRARRVVCRAGEVRRRVQDERGSGRQSASKQRVCRVHLAHTGREGPLTKRPSYVKTATRELP